jgi:hypothetical protein
VKSQELRAKNRDKELEVKGPQPGEEEQDQEDLGRGGKPLGEETKERSWIVI